MVKKAKKRGLKRGRKPGVKVGPYKKRKQSDPIDPVTDEMTITSVVGSAFKVGDRVTFSNNPILPLEKSKSFADCIFEIVNSNMDQQTKLAAFKAMEEAAKTEVVKAY